MGAAGDDPADPARGGSLRWLRWPLLGLGVAAAGTGAYLIALDGDCVGQEVPDQICPKLWETLEPGLGLAAVGAVAIGGALWWHFSGGDERQPVAGVAIGSEGVSVYVRGAF